MIEQGLLWFSDDKDLSTVDKVSRAAVRYEQKYGHKPDVCYAHPSTLQGVNEADLPVKTLPLKSVLPNHFWLGVEIKEQRRKEPVRHAKRQS